MSTRIEIVGGPWPERIGRQGVTVDDPGDGIYPFDKRASNEAVVLLDNDPLGSGTRSWTCVYSKRYLRYLPGAGESAGVTFDPE
jgi:hypothetical protein